MRAIGRAYVTYAFNQPHRFRVIFGRLPLDKTDSEPGASGARAFGVLASTIAALPRHGTQNDGDVALAWSVVHGFATLVYSLLAVAAFVQAWMGQPLLG